MPSVDWLTSAMPEPWRVTRQGRSFMWTGQAMGDPAPISPVRFGLDERAVLYLGATASGRKAPVRRRQLNFFLLEWARQRALQWMRLLSGKSCTEVDALMAALRRYEIQVAIRLADRVWAASLNAKLGLSGRDGFASDGLLRWVIGARDAPEYRRRRSLAQRYGSLMAMAMQKRGASRLKWPWCLRRLTEGDLPLLLRHLKLPRWAQQRIGSIDLRQAFSELPLDQQLVAWQRLSAQLPQRLWPRDPQQLEAAEAVLAYLSPLFSFGLPISDAHDVPGSERRLRWVLGRLHGDHAGSWKGLLQALRSDAPLAALMHGTLPRLREVMAIVHDGDDQVLEIFSSPLREWGAGRWRVALQDWHHRTLGGRPGAKLRWNGLLATAVAQHEFCLSSPTAWDELEELLDAVSAADWRPLLTNVLQGSAQFLAIRAAADDALLGLAVLSTAAPKAAVSDADWPRQVELRFVPSLLVDQQASAQSAVGELLTKSTQLDWPLLHWRQNWENALRDPILAKSLACSFLKIWHLNAP